jgi:hypothetical protein
MKPLPKLRLLSVTGAAAADVAALPPLVRSLIEGASERFVEILKQVDDHSRLFLEIP